MAGPKRSLFILGFKFWNFFIHFFHLSRQSGKTTLCKINFLDESALDNLAKIFAGMVGAGR